MATQTDLGIVRPVNKGVHIEANAYEEMNMVTNGGKVYMANKTVPADTIITNEEFWINMSGDGMTVPQLQSWAKTEISDDNKILTEFEEAQINASLTTVNGKIDDNTALIGLKVGVTDYASSTIGGVVKVRLDGTTAYITTDGTDA